jgi:hypothetical protein
VNTTTALIGHAVDSLEPPPDTHERTLRDPGFRQTPTEQFLR